MSSSEENRLLNFFHDVDSGDDAGKQLVWDSDNKCIRVVNAKDPDDRNLSYKKPVLGYSSDGR